MKAGTRAYYKVINEFDSNLDYGRSIQSRYQNCLVLLKKDDVFSQTDFLEKNHNSLGIRKKLKPDSAKIILNVSIKIAKDIGLLERVDNDANTTISFKDFCKLETVDYFAQQLRGSKLKNLKDDKFWIKSTRGQYLYRLLRFNNWLHGRKFEYSKIRYIDNDTFKKERVIIILEGVEHFLKLYQESINSDSDYIKVIKRYLMDKEFHKDSSVIYMKQKHIAITSYFEKNDSPLKFHYNPSAMYDEADYNIPKLITLKDVSMMLSKGKASLLDHAVVLCKFQRGLDILTLIDRFNFQAWEQLVEYFGTDIYEKWDLEKCPVPITLVRIKTTYKHRGFLDRDAITSLQEYLKYRYEQTGETLQNGMPMFITNRKKPINHQWVMELIPRLAKNAGIQKKLIYKNKMLNQKTSHELRDLLKSTLIACDVAQYVCDLAIGHKVGDSYEKQDELYPDKTRSEYMKASNKLNIITKSINAINEKDSSEELKIKLEEMRDKSDLSNFKNQQQIESLVKTQEKLILQMNMIQKALPITEE